MSTARHHADWLSLIEVSGPFLSMPVLMDVFPHGLSTLDSELVKELRVAYNQWQDNQGGNRPDPAMHRGWIRYVLTTLLGHREEYLLESQVIPQGLTAQVAEHGETLRPDIVLQRADRNEAAQLLVTVLPYRQDLDKVLPNVRWKAPPSTRMATLLRAADVPLGLITNGEQWMLVYAPRGETAGFASWYAQLWLDEPVTLRAFRDLLEAHRFFSVPDEQVPSALFKKSAQNQQEVTDQLGDQVRQAVEMLVQTLDRIDRDRGRTLLADLPETVLYEAALTVMMRLVFLFSAEERGMLLLGNEHYDRSYAVSTLRAQLRTAANQYGEEVLERRSDAWSRLLATFRVVYGGIGHAQLRLPAYGGDLFNPDRFPFLEGRPSGSRWADDAARPLPIDNRTVLHLLEALQVLRVKVPGGGYEPRLLSFRALDIEQIGHVYEGLLDHTAARATTPVLGLVGAKGREPEVALPVLEEHARKGDAALLSFLEDTTERSLKTLQKALAEKPDMLRVAALRVACENSEQLLARVLPFAGLIRDDTFERPVVIPQGSLYVTTGTDRRSSGTHYTPRSLTEPIVQHTLDPLVYVGPAEGMSKEQWKLRSASDILKLKVCDIAMGSGAFLVQACRYLSERLVEAWENAEAVNRGRVVITPEGELSTGAPDERPLPRDTEERLAIARRIVADRCLYGVDKNQLAVEMAKLSLWLITLQKDRPFTFLDHALKCGDSLLGVDLDQLKTWSLKRGEPVQLSWFTKQLEDALDTALHLRRQIAATTVIDARDAEHKARLLHEANEAMRLVQLGADLLMASALASPNLRDNIRAESLHRFSVAADSFRQRRDSRFTAQGAQPDRDALADLRREANNLLGQHHPFHWPLEFPEVFVETNTPGFDAIIGNPPFQGGQKITGVLGTAYRDYLVEYIANGQRGSADLCAYFFLRSKEIVRYGGGMGLLATNTIAQGDTREVGLDQLINDSCVITRAVPSRRWPGAASLEIAHLWLRYGTWNGLYELEEQAVNGITSFLTKPSTAQGMPHQLVINNGKSFIGSYVLGIGFVLEPEEAEILIAKDQRNSDVLFPYVNGEDLNSRPDQSPSRWVINFHDWSLEQARTYPDCMRIVEERVRPEREKQNDKGGKEFWWRFLRTRPELYNTIRNFSRVLVRARIANIHSMVYVPNGWVYNEKVVVFPNCSFAVMQSNIHEVWARAYSSSLKKDMQYTPSDCFDNFPFPSRDASLDSIGETYHEHRRLLMLDRQEGLTKTYNRFHNQVEIAGDIVELRRLHVEMDQAVATVYGWNDLDLGHGFHETKQGLRFTISEEARREVLDRLLLLNHQRYEQEVKDGLHEKGAKNPATKKAPVSTSASNGASGRKPVAKSVLPLKPREPEQNKLF